MKVILLMDVARLGRRLEVKEVPDGHALNFLIPRKLAVPATTENMKRHEERMKKNAEVTAHGEEALHETLSKLKDQTVVIKASANEQGHLFKGIKAADVAAHIAKEVGMLQAEHLHFAEPIKEVGSFPIEAKAGKQHASFTLTIEKQ